VLNLNVVLYIKVMEIIYSNLDTKVNYCNGVQTPCQWSWNNSHWASEWRWDITACPNLCSCGTVQPVDPTLIDPICGVYCGWVFDGVNYPNGTIPILDTYCAQV